jgi:hypothetical protein
MFIHEYQGLIKTERTFYIIQFYFEFEKQYVELLPNRNKIIFSKFRTSTLDLLIKKGRWKNISRSYIIYKICQCCELYYILQCTILGLCQKKMHFIYSNCFFRWLGVWQRCCEELLKWKHNFIFCLIQNVDI